jgi:HD-GYP domain-containing protein (c-di-GMP phosphodiesterase class II)
LAAKKQSENAEVKSEGLDVRPAELLAAASYLIDIIPSGCLHHCWRIALVAEHVAAAAYPDQATDIFYAGLLQEVGTVGAHKHATQYASLQEQIDDPLIKTHPRRGAALLDWLPGMGGPAKLVRYHHEWWDGRGYQDGRVGNEVPEASQVLLLVETMDAAGCFASWPALSKGLRQLAKFTNHAWNAEVWASVVHSLEDSEFYTSVINSVSLQGLMSERLARHPLPPEMDSEEGVERIFHIFAALVDAKDPSTSGHSHRTAKLAKGLGEHMGLSPQDVRIAYRAGLVHDCGRLGVPTPLLKRSGRLNAEEMELVRKHAQMTTRVMSCMPACPNMEAIGEIAGHDHERYDGTGYPDRLVGENIPLISRILCVVDAFDAMTSTTSYKNLLSPRFAVIRLQQAAGTQFDPNIVDAMTTAVEGRVLELELPSAA